MSSGSSIVTSSELIEKIVTSVLEVSPPKLTRSQELLYLADVDRYMYREKLGKLTQDLTYEEELTCMQKESLKYKGRLSDIEEKIKVVNWLIHHDIAKQYRSFF